MPTKQNQCWQYKIVSETQRVRCQHEVHPDTLEHSFAGAPLEERDDNPPTPITWSYADCAQLALDAQDACNSTALIHSLSRQILPKLWEESRKRAALGKPNGTDWVNNHPILYLFLFKLLDLAKGSNDLPFAQAYETVKAIAGGHTEVY